MKQYLEKRVKMKTKKIKPIFSMSVKLKNKRNRFLPFNQARVFVKNLKLKSTREWRRYCKSGEKPKNIPSNPHTVYENKGWKHYGNFLGTNRRARTKYENILSFKDAREFVISLKLKNCREWKMYCRSGRKPRSIVSTPSRYYKDKGWVNWNDWLGNNNLTKKQMSENFLSFKEAREYARSLKLNSQKEWYEYFRTHDRPFNIPSSPCQPYKNKGWINWPDWLGVSYLHTFHNRKKDFLPFKEAREFARNLKLKSSKEWREYRKAGLRPDNIPSAPDRTYKDKGWIDFEDWLGIKRFFSFEEARKIARKLEFGTLKEWKEYCRSGKKHINMPSCPEKAYRDKWAGWGDWLGIRDFLKQSGRGRKRKKFIHFKEARKFARSLGLKRKEEWNEISKLGLRPDNIPSAPYMIYYDSGWNGWKDWLGY